MSEYIVLTGTDSVTLSLPLNIANMCGTVSRMTEMVDINESLELPVPFPLSNIGDKLKEYLEMHVDNPEFSKYKSTGCHGERKNRKYEPWTNYSLSINDEQWGRGIKYPDLLHKLYHLADFLEVQSLMDLCTYALNGHALETLYSGKMSLVDKAKMLRAILIGDV